MVQQLLQELLLSDLPQRFLDRRRVVSAALGSHMQYEESISNFTQWLVAFERTNRDIHDVYLDDVESAVKVIKVNYFFVQMFVFILGLNVGNLLGSERV